MLGNTSRNVKAALTAGVVASALLIPTAGSAAASSSGPVVTVRAVDPNTACRHHGKNYIVRTYFRGPTKYTLRCGKSSWGWKHIKAGHGWNNTMNKKISAAIWSGKFNGGGFSTWTASCPSREKFRTKIGTPAGRNDLRTAYQVSSLAAASC
ncbi:hypothetical protein OG453_04610 [Streptomyces sp. NBC_01381]|uniref:hypothetical protein n=1 Tax=Streptomyces sp. NBC_01381 TaxID=2903845 RepID=UPI00224E2AB7|nr:hypothetical protein [Streptomyces sp. NBC_01381]MCX4665959.1 hypothetical protein [Streptomyces sp. NBC_01381]